MNIQDLKSNTTWQEASNTINNNNNKISLAIATLENAKLKNKGYFITVEKLNEAIPNPTIGSKAYVGTSEPYAIYIVENGAWVDSGYTGGDEIVAKITTDRIEDGAVTTEKIATSAFDSTLSISGKIAPADVVGEKIAELESKESIYNGFTKTYSHTFSSSTSVFYFGDDIYFDSCKKISVKISANGSFKYNLYAKDENNTNLISLGGNSGNKDFEIDVPEGVKRLTLYFYNNASDASAEVEVIHKGENKLSAERLEAEINANKEDISFLSKGIYCDNKIVSKSLKELYIGSSDGDFDICCIRQIRRNVDGEYVIILNLHNNGDTENIKTISLNGSSESDLLVGGRNEHYALMDWSLFDSERTYYYAMDEVVINQETARNIAFSPYIAHYMIQESSKNAAGLFAYNDVINSCIKEMRLTSFSLYDRGYISQIRKNVSGKYMVIVILYKSNDTTDTKSIPMSSDSINDVLSANNGQDVAVVNWGALPTEKTYYYDKDSGNLNMDSVRNGMFSPAIKVESAEKEIKENKSALDALRTDINTTNKHVQSVEALAESKLGANQAKSISMSMLTDEVIALIGGGSEGGTNYLPDTDDLAVSGRLLRFADRISSTGKNVVFARANADGQYIADNTVFATGNTIYIVRNDYVVRGTLVMPNNCVLVFLGGSFNSGTIQGNGTSIIATHSIFKNVALEGSWSVEGWDVRWFGLVADDTTDNRDALQYAINAFSNMYGNRPNTGYATCPQGLYFPSGRYYVGGRVTLPNKLSIHGDGVTSVITTDYNGILLEFESNDISYRTIHLYDMGFEYKYGNDNSDSVLFKSQEHTHIALGHISRCKFVNFGKVIDFNVSYWLRIDSCDFCGSKNYDLFLHNPNDISVTNCNFRADDDVTRRTAIYMYGGLGGVNITGNDFSGGKEASIVALGNISGLNITGNYFEGIYSLKTPSGSNYECYRMPFLELGSPSSVVSNVVVQGNCTYEDNQNSTAENLPRYYIQLNCSTLENCKLDGDISIPSGLVGHGNIGVVSFHSSEILKAKFEQSLALTNELLNLNIEDAIYSSKIQDKISVDNDIKNILSSIDSSATSIGRNVFSIITDRKTGDVYIKS